MTNSAAWRMIYKPKDTMSKNFSILPFDRASRCHALKQCGQTPSVGCQTAISASITPSRLINTRLISSLDKFETALNVVAKHNVRLR